MAPELDILTRNPVTRNSDVADLGKSPRRSGAGTAGLSAGIPWAGGWGTRRGPCCGIGASAETSGSEGGDTPEASPMRPQRTVPKAGRSRQPEASTVRLAAEPRAPGKHPWLPPEPSPRLSHTAWPHSWCSSQRAARPRRSPHADARSVTPTVQKGQPAAVRQGCPRARPAGRRGWSSARRGGGPPRAGAVPACLLPSGGTAEMETRFLGARGQRWATRTRTCRCSGW